jgi:hypothetical protein
MGESLLHKILVSALLDEMNARTWDSAPFLYADLNGAALPPIIGNVRPDVYAHFTTQNRAIIGEAKTSADLESFHTAQQLEQYFWHLETKDDGELWLAVPWLSAGKAVRICTAIKTQSECSITFRVAAYMFGERQFSRVWYG